MKWVAVVLLGVSLSSAFAEDTASLEKCLAGVRTDLDFYRRVIPPGIYAMDRRLYQMSFGVPLLEENAAILKKKISSSEFGEAEKHLLANAAQGCESFHENYRRRIRQFLSLSSCIVLLLALLTLRALSTIFAREKRKPDEIIPANVAPIESMPVVEPVDRSDEPRR